MKEIGVGDIWQKVVRPLSEARQAHETATERDAGREAEPDDERFFLGFALALAVVAGSDRLREPAYLGYARRMMGHPTVRSAFLFFSTGSMPTVK